MVDYGRLVRVAVVVITGFAQTLSMLVIWGANHESLSA